MRCCFRHLGLLAAALLAGCGRTEDTPSPQSPPAAALAPKPPSLIRFHFLGTTRLASDTNAATWVDMAQLPASQTLWNQTRQKLAAAPYQLFQHRIAPTTNEHRALFQEFIADLLRAESFAEVAGDTNRLAEAVLALRLPADRAAFWQTNLLTVIEDWTGQRGESLPPDGHGWQVKKHHEPNRIRFARAGDWTLLAVGNDPLPLLEQHLQNLKQTGRPLSVRDDSWLELTLDYTALAPAWSSAFRRPRPAPSTPEPPEGGTPNFQPPSTATLSLSGRDANLRLRGELAFREPVPWRPEPWQIPTNLIHDPIIGFTAARGLSPLFDTLSKHLGYKLDAFPNQQFVWAGAHFPFQALAAAPVDHAPQLFYQLAPQLMARYHSLLQSANAGYFVYATNAAGQVALRWTDIPPFVTPFFSTAQDSGMEFLVAGIHPNWSSDASPALAVIYQYLETRTNLVYYDWEITGPRVYSWRAIINIFRHFFEKPRLQPDTASIVWINSVSNRLGNTVTEITQTDVRKLALVRQGPIAVTSLELMLLAYWLESPGFPLNGYALPARASR